MRIFLYILLLISSNLCEAQNPYSITIDKSLGLLSNSVYDIIQDKDNNMWFTTEKGLCQFNGYVFQYYDQNEMTTKAGSCIQQDLFGRIWYENFDGYIYYIENNTLKRLNQKKSIGYFKFGIVKDQIYVVNKNAIDIYDLNDLHFKKSITIKANEIKTIFFDQETIYLFTDKLITIKNDKIQNVINLPNDFTNNFNSILVEKSANGLLIASKFSNYYYHFSNGNFHKRILNIKNTIIQNLSWCNNKNWFCTTTGIIEIDENTNTSNKYFNNTNISYIYKTKNNNFWISTLTEGLFFIEDFKTKLINSNESLTTINFGQNQIFIGTKNDKIYSFLNNKFKLIYTGNENHQVGQLFFDFFSNQLFFTDSKFGTINNGNIVSNKIAIAVKNVCSIDEKYIAFAASSTSGIFKKSNSKKSDWDLVFNKFSQPTTFDYSNIIQNEKGKATSFSNKYKLIYFATNNALYCVNTKGKIIEIKLNNKSLKLSKLSCSNNKIYASNSDLKIYEIDNTIVKEITIPNTINKKSVEKTIQKNECIYVITNKFIFEFNLISKKTKQIIHINNNIEINDIDLKNNYYYITTNRGLILKEVEKYKRVNPVFKIESIKINNNIVDSLKIKELNYDENNIKINYRFLSPIPFEEHELLYRINNSQWQRANITNPEIVLNSLNYGNYTIEFVLNSNFNNSTKIQFTIHSPIWLRFPFIIIGLIIIIGLTYWLYKNKIEKIKSRNQLILDKINLEKNVNQSKLKAIKSQMNPHFFYNALNTLQSYILSNEKKEAIEYLSKFSNLTRIILEQTEKEWITISEEIKTLILYLDIEKVRFENDLIYTIETSSDIDCDLVKIPTMLIQPYVENAIKHGLLHKKEIKLLDIYFYKKDNILEIKINDNGIGRKKSSELNRIKNKNHQSFATDAIQNRINLINQYNNKNISIEIIDNFTPTNQPSGTTIIIKIPF